MSDIDKYKIDSMVGKISANLFMRQQISAILLFLILINVKNCFFFISI